MLSNNLSKKSVEIDPANLGKHMLKIGSAVIVVGLAWSALYTIDEGHVGIVKRFGEATTQVNPGLHYKIPFADSVTELEIRTRKNSEALKRQPMSKCQCK